MKNIIKGTCFPVRLASGALILAALFISSCKKTFLDEKPLDRFSPENLLVDSAGFEAAEVALYQAARQEYALGGANFDYMNLGTDIVGWGRADSRGFNDYTLVNSQSDFAKLYWNWGYTDMIRQSNLILDNLNNDDLKMTQTAKASFTAVAKFFRAYTYNILYDLYRGVPIVEHQITEPKFDFQRASKEEVLRFIISDLVTAGEGLPSVQSKSDGRVYKAAAYQLLTEVYIDLAVETANTAYYDSAIAAATKIINGETGHYQLMTERFGDLSRPGDAFSDLFWTNQQNRASGNLEVIWSLQYESFTIGGEASTGGNNAIRLWEPEIDKITTPNGIANVNSDSLQRGIGVMCPTNYLKYDLWQDDAGDMRNSVYNIRRIYYYTNPKDQEYFGKPVKTGKDSKGNVIVLQDDGTPTKQVLDTTREYYPWIRKFDGLPFNDNVVNGQTANDIIKMRLGETYLLRAEAYFRKGEPGNAATDINTVRSRAHAPLIDGDDVTIDFILDERARELLGEEPRRRTLSRMGKLYERVKRYNPRCAKTVQPYNELWPIPQSVIDANTAQVIEQNDGY